MTRCKAHRYAPDNACALNRGPPLAAPPALRAEKPAKKLAGLTEQKLGTALRVPKVLDFA